MLLNPVTFVYPWRPLIIALVGPHDRNCPSLTPPSLSIPPGTGDVWRVKGTDYSDTKQYSLQLKNNHSTEGRWFDGPLVLSAEHSSGGLSKSQDMLWSLECPACQRSILAFACWTDLERSGDRSGLAQNCKTCVRQSNYPQIFFQMFRGCLYQQDRSLPCRKTLIFSTGCFF